MMHTADVLKVFAEHRGDAIVVSGRGGRHWIQISDTALDVPLGDPAMGGHSGFGLGLALAQPNRRVVLFDSEGDILMSLGQLVPSPNRRRQISITSSWTTRSTRPPAASRCRVRRHVDYAGIARASGYANAHSFTALQDFNRALPAILGAPWTNIRHAESVTRGGEYPDRAAGEVAEAFRRQGCGRSAGRTDGRVAERAVIRLTLLPGSLGRRSDLHEGRNNLV